ncbi:hypothetical protein SBA7_320067 [Candidatus Sulfotelmatobacter sp. SbA7]|nr:hypothetical protein SBA7_320067 [Candidatus Sulfotelmatobacter sp. SbA7]
MTSGSYKQYLFRGSLDREKKRSYFTFPFMEPDSSANQSLVGRPSRDCRLGSRECRVNPTR